MNAKAEPLRGAARFLDALHMQFIVVGAVMMREIHTRYGRDNLGFLWIMVEPLMFCLGVIVIWASAHLSLHGVPVIAFIILVTSRWC